MNVTLSASGGQTSKPVTGVPAGARVTVTPTGGYAVVEYTLDSDADIQNGVAIWAPWAIGSVFSEQTDIAENDCAVRVQCYSGTASLSVTDTEPQNALGDWRSTIRSGPLPAGNIRTILIGDSITNQCYSEFATGQFGIACNGYFAHASMATFGALRLVAELGVSADTTRNMLARTRQALETYRPDLVVILGGTNDITNQNISADTAIANLTAMARLCQRYGALCAMFTIPPKDAATDGATTDYATKHAKINWAIQYQIGRLPGVVVADAYSTVVDVSTGLWAANMSDDGTHPVANATIRHGIALANAINPYIPTTYRAPTMTMHQLDGWNIAYNPYMTGNNASGTNGFSVTTGVTGNGPNGYAVGRLTGTSSATVAKTTESGSLMKREWTRITVASFGADSDSFVVRNDINQNSTWATGISPAIGSYRRPTVYNGYAYRVITTAGATGATEPVWPTVLGRTIVDGGTTWQCVPLIEPGGRYVGVGEYKISGVTGSVSPVLVASCRDAGGSVIADMTGNRRATSDALPDTFVANGVIWTPEFICPAGVNRVLFQMGIYGSNGGAVTFDVKGMGFYRIPDGYEMQDLLSGAAA